MRIAVLIIALFLTVVVSLQSCAVFVGSGIAKNEALSQGGAVGLLVSLLFVIGAAFALGVPRVSQIVFTIAAAFAFLAASKEYPDMNVWGVAALILAVMSYFGVREARKLKAQSAKG